MIIKERRNPRTRTSFRNLTSSSVGIFLLGFRARYSGVSCNHLLRSATAEIRTVRRQPNNVGLWPARELPKGRRRTDLPFTSVAGRRQLWIILKNRQRFFVVAIRFPLTPLRCLPPRPRGPSARPGQRG